MQTDGSLATSFVDGRKIESTLKHTDAEFWRVYQFAFLEGSAYGSGRRRVGASRRRDQRDEPEALLQRPAGPRTLHRRRRAAVPGDRRGQGRAVAAYAVSRPLCAADDAEVEGLGGGVPRQLRAGLPARGQRATRGRARRAALAPVDVEATPDLASSRRCRRRSRRPSNAWVVASTRATPTSRAPTAGSWRCCSPARR